jgi:hypothetical protein
MSTSSDCKWVNVCNEIQVNMDNIPTKLHYDNVKKTKCNKGQIVNPSIRGKLIKRVHIEENKIIVGKQEEGNIIIDFICEGTSETCCIFKREKKNILFHLKNKK